MKVYSMWVTLSPCSCALSLSVVWSLFHTEFLCGSLIDLQTPTHPSVQILTCYWFPGVPGPPPHSLHLRWLCKGERSSHWTAVLFLRFNRVGYEVGVTSRQSNIHPFFICTETFWNKNKEETAEWKSWLCSEENNLSCFMLRSHPVGIRASLESSTLETIMHAKLFQSIKML